MDSKLPEMEPTKKTTTLLLFGKTGSGRSAMGNSILGCKAFAASPMFNTTKTYKIETCERDNGTLRVVDTPDITESLDHLPDNDPTREVAKWLVETKDGIDAILLIHKFGVRFTDQQKTLLGALENYFGKDVYKHSIVVLTHGDLVDEALKDGSLTSMDAYVSEDWGGLPKLMKKVGNRYVVFNNRTEDEDGKKKQMKCLLDFVKQISDQNKVPYKSPYCSGIVTSTAATEPKIAAGSPAATDQKAAAGSPAATDQKAAAGSPAATDQKAAAGSPAATDQNFAAVPTTATDPKIAAAKATTEISADPKSLFEEQVNKVQQAIKAKPSGYFEMAKSLFNKA